MDEIHANLQHEGNKICPAAIVHEGHEEDFVKRKKLKNKYFLLSPNPIIPILTLISLPGAAIEINQISGEQNSHALERDITLEQSQTS